jgi:hypothetical protein
VAAQSAANSIPVRLYELRDANLATYSPTEFSVVGPRAAAILAEVGAKAAELDRRAVVASAIEGTFVKAAAARMTLARDGYDVTARSEGRSAILLPLQFSNCLTLVDRAGGAFRPYLVRANFLQTLLVFEGASSASIRFDFGLGQRAACRLRDAAELQEMMR